MEDRGVFSRRIKNGEKYKKFEFGLLENVQFRLDLFIVRPETWGVQFAIRTGPADFSHRFVTNKSLGGLLPNEMTVRDGLLWRAGVVVPTLEEVDFFTAIGLDWIEPEDRR